MEEIWKDIKQHTNYQVSNLGRVKTKERIHMRSNGIPLTVKEKIKNQHFSSNNYPVVSLSKNNKSINKQVHQLVAIAFLNHKPCGHKIVVDHIDENKRNNNVNNLQLLTNRENCKKSRDNSKFNSLYDGVCYHINHKKYHSSIVSGRKRIFIGAFKTEKEAYKAYQKALSEVLSGKDVTLHRAKQTSKYKNISMNKKTVRGKTYVYWLSYIFIKGKRINIGQFKTEQEAYKARQEYIEENNL